MNKPALILASASIGRKNLLEKLGVPFKVKASEINEDIIIHENPLKMLQMRATAKAKDVAHHLVTYNLQHTTYNYLVIAADSMAILEGKTFGKAKDKHHAQHIITTLMGKTHDFATATSIIHLKSLKSPKSLIEANRWETTTKTPVTMRKMSKRELDEYVNRYDFARFAAGYALNETPWDLVTKIDGSYTNVIGLPFEVVLPVFRSLKLLK